jgi:glucosyl-3-phosphoglycerate synthase
MRSPYAAQIQGAPSARVAERIAGEVERWFERRTYDGRAYSAESLLAAKRASVSLVLPAREVAATIGSMLDIVQPLRSAGLIDELLVVDAASEDGTADICRRRGVAVLQQSELCTDAGPCLGKGDALWRGLSATTGELVVFLDSDTAAPTSTFVLGLLAPLLLEPDIKFVKGAFERPFKVGSEAAIAGGGGRVTELTARPLLNLHFPLLTGFIQPLSGEIAARRELLEALPFAVGYGVEIAMLIDSLELVGLDGLAQSRLGTRQNQHQQLRDLGPMAYAVLAAVERRLGRPSAAEPTYVLAGEGLERRNVALDERPPLREVTGTRDGEKAAGTG